MKALDISELSKKVVSDRDKCIDERGKLSAYSIADLTETSLATSYRILHYIQRNGEGAIRAELSKEKVNPLKRVNRKQF